MFKEHGQMLGGLIALAMIVAATLVLTLHGMKDETLLAILATGAVGIASNIAGVPKPQTPPPGTSSFTAINTAPAPLPPDPAISNELPPTNSAKDKKL